MLPKFTEGVRFHINNGGVSFGIVERVREDGYKDGTYLVVSVEHFGIRTNLIELPVTNEGLAMLGDYLLKRSGDRLKLFHEHALIPHYFRIDKDG